MDGGLQEVTVPGFHLRESTDEAHAHSLLGCGAMALPIPTSSDRRAHPRHPFRTAATLTLSDNTVIQARTLDISASGAGVVSDLNLKVGAKVTLRMRVPARPSGSAAFEARASVANCTLASSDGGFRLGLEFEPLDSAAQAALKGVLP